MIKRRGWSWWNGMKLKIKKFLRGNWYKRDGLPSSAHLISFQLIQYILNYLNMSSVSAIERQMLIGLKCKITTFAWERNDRSSEQLGSKGMITEWRVRVIRYPHLQCWALECVFMLDEVAGNSRPLTTTWNTLKLRLRQTYRRVYPMFHQGLLHQSLAVMHP